MDLGGRDRHALEVQIARRAGVLHHGGLVAEVAGRTHRGVDAHVAHGADHRDLVNAAAKEVDEAKRTALLQDAQEIEYDEGGLIVWGFRQQVDGYASNVQGLEPSKYLPLGNYKFSKVSI